VRVHVALVYKVAIFMSRQIFFIAVRSVLYCLPQHNYIAYNTFLMY
jgi:hypothetical protein